MDINNIPAAISTFDVYLVLHEENDSSRRQIVWQEVFELPVQPQLLFNKNATIINLMNNFPEEINTQIHQICALTQGHARSLENISYFLTQIRKEAFDVGTLFTYMKAYYGELNKTIDDDVLIKLLMLDISKENLTFTTYFRNISRGKIDNLGNLKWDNLIREAIVLNKMIFQDQNVKLNLLTLNIFATEKELSICGPLLNLFTNLPEIQKNNSVSFEKFHVSYEASKYNCCVEFCNSFLEKKRISENIDKFKIGNLEFQIMEIEAKQVWTLPLYMWLDKPNNKGYENKFIIFEKQKQSLQTLKRKTILNQKELFSTIIINSDNYFVNPTNWKGYDASLLFQIFDQSGRNFNLNPSIIFNSFNSNFFR